MVSYEKGWAQAAPSGLLASYAMDRIRLHTDENYTDYTLWSVFQEDFEMFTLDDFERMRADVRMKLRAHLLRRGVFVAAYSEIYPVARVLYDVAQEAEPHIWTDDDLKSTLNEISPMTTVALRNRLTPSMDGLATTTQNLPLDPPLSSHANSSVPNESDDDPTLVSPIIDQATRTEYVEKTITVMELYTDDLKYNGWDDILDIKLKIFYDFCRMADLPPAGYMIAFPHMLKGPAQTCYYGSTSSTESFADAIKRLRQLFEGPAFYRKNLDAWNTITLQGIMDESPDQPIYKCFRLLINELSKLRWGLHPDYRTDRQYADKIVTACQSVPACHLATWKPSEDHYQLIKDIRSSISVWEATNPSPAMVNSPQQAYSTDRRYNRNNRDTRNSRNSRNTYDKTRDIR
ncbi:hypothetical protein BP6252_13253 [Coleophoma cylindrospora]|uniref:Uncharacterized protein n=1 Tax=Coleophoma cylindrospora TaxID=1849047 RepID=A0A3D8QAR4_9HELO|nr:hypothetical protein BP6252_13253 [Coleophoma cylindrospora]